MVSVDRIQFRSRSGSMLAGVLHLPESPRAGILMAHCFTCSKDIHTTTRVAGALADSSFAVMRFDFTGLGESGGQFSDTSMTTNVDDLAAAAVVMSDHGIPAGGLFGHSLGGAAAIMAAPVLKEVRSVAVLAMPASLSRVRRLLKGLDDEIMDGGDEALVEIGGRPFAVSRQFLDQLGQIDLTVEIARLGRPVLILHGLLDRVVDPADGEALFAAARRPKAFMPLIEGDHLLSSRPVASRAGRFIASWFEATLT